MSEASAPDVMIPITPVISSNVDKLKAPQFNTDKAKTTLVNPRTISKQNDLSGRNETAGKVLEARRNVRNTEADIAEKAAKIEKIAELTSTSYQQERQKTFELTQRTESLVYKVKKIIGFGDRRAQDLQKGVDEIRSQRSVLYAESWDLEQQLKEAKQKLTESPTPSQLLEAYYEKQLTTPLTNEQKRDLLKPEVLASLSTQEYIALWRRLNPYFLSHVTRQGFRDHNAMMYHSAGIQEFHNGFTETIKDQQMIRPPFAVDGLRSRDEKTVKEFIGPWVLEAENEEEARVRLRGLLDAGFADAPRYPDKIAVHFTNELVGDGYYGGESDNEIFFLFPADFIASQYNYAFNGKEKDFTKPQSELKWNDVFVWPNSLENPGISLDSGMVFLPKSTRVDPETGSKYASKIEIENGQQKRVMVENTQVAKNFAEYIKTKGRESNVYKAFLIYKNEQNYFRKQDLEREYVGVCKDEFQQLGFTEDASILLAKKLTGEFYWREELIFDGTNQGKPEPGYPNKAFEEVLRESGAVWKRADNTISSQEYWLQYFNANPNLMPKHIIFYDGSPTAAVMQFQRDNKIGTEEASGLERNLLGFDGNHVLLKGSGGLFMDHNQDPRAMVGYDDLVKTANKIISEHYAKSTPVQPQA